MDVTIKGISLRAPNIKREMRVANSTSTPVAVTVKGCVVLSALLNSILDGNEQSLYEYNELNFSAKPESPGCELRSYRCE